WLPAVGNESDASGHSAAIERSVLRSEPAISGAAYSDDIFRAGVSVGHRYGQNSARALRETELCAENGSVVGPGGGVEPDCGAFDGRRHTAGFRRWGRSHSRG